MKILLISSFFPPKHTAGSEKRTYGYARTLLAEGHEVQVLCAGSFDEGRHYWNGYTDEVYRGIVVRRVHLNWRLAPDPNRYLYENSVIAEHMDSWVAGWQPDVVHVISCYTLSASIIKVFNDHGLPVVLTLVDFWFICPRLSLLHGDGSLCDGRTTAWECLKCLLWGAKVYRWPSRILPETVVKRALTCISRHPMLSRQRGLCGMALDMDHRKRYLVETLHQVDAITAPSQTLADTVRKVGMPLAIHMIHSGHDLSWLTSMPEREPSSAVRFGYIGQINPTKGVYELVAAFERAELGPRACLQIHGDHHKNPEYTEKVVDLLEDHVSGVTFYGPFLPDYLGDVLARIDVLVVPSIWWENNPRVVQEAFAAGVPVIASDVAGIAEFVEHEVNGLLFERGNVEDLACQMRRIVEEPTLLNQLRAGIPPVREIDEEVHELLAVYAWVRGGTNHE